MAHPQWPRRMRSAVRSDVGARKIRRHAALRGGEAGAVGTVRHGYSFSRLSSILAKSAMRRLRVSGLLAVWMRHRIAYRLRLSSVAKKAFASGRASSAAARSGGTVAVLGAS